MLKIKLKKKFWKRLLISIIVLPVLIFSIAIGVLYLKQDAIVQHFIKVLNEDFTGEISIKGSHISPFANFPYLSIDLEDVRIYQDKNKSKSNPMLSVKDGYIGFDLWTMITKGFEIKTIYLKDGYLNVVQDKQGEFNIVKAFQTTKEIEDTSEEFHMDLKKIKLSNVGISKYNEENEVLIDFSVSKGQFRFKTSEEHLIIGMDANFDLNVLKGEDTTYIKKKHFDIETHLDFNKKNHVLFIEPSEIKLEKASFGMDGKIDIDNDMEMDIKFHGNKSNFDLLIAFAPEELIPTLKMYENEGKVFFDASIKGKSMNGHTPLIEAAFGCENAYFTNTINDKTVDQLQFKGHFSNGEKRTLSTMEFSLTNFSAKPEAGKFTGDVYVKNFEEPDINVKLSSDFDLNFLAQFFNLEDLKNLRGKVKLTMNFHDIVDLRHPERSLEKINQSYFSELIVSNLSFSSPEYHLPIKNMNVHATVTGKKAEIDRFELKIGTSDVSFHGEISDLPAIIHHSDEEVKVNLDIHSKQIDLKELTTSKQDSQKFIDEKIENFAVDFAFKSSARAFTESPNLPVGEFFIKNLYAKFKNYPHTLHDFRADVFIDEKDFRVIDFSGEIDKTDFHFSGKLENYDLWFSEHSTGDTKIEFDVTSNLIKLNNLLTYNGVNYLPEDYRNEELSHFKLHGHADLHFKEKFHSADIYLDRVNAKMKLHPLKFEQFRGNLHLEDEYLTVNKLQGKMGHSSFIVDLNYYYGKDTKIRKKDNYLGIKAPRLDIDELTNFTPAPVSSSNGTVKVDHDAGFNIYDLPFTDMRFDLDIGILNYHNYKLSNVKGKLHTTENHYLYIDNLDLNVAGGNIHAKGYFNGANSKAIYLSPEITFKKLDIDQLMLKFDNFGQDELVSKNLHGSISGKLTGKIHVHTDFVPIIDDSEIHLDFEVLNGRLDNYGPMYALSDFFKDKNLDRIAFDTLKNTLDLKNGTLTVPAMTINTTLGFIEVSGKQDKNLNMEYYVRVPFKMVTSVAATKLFGRKKEEIDPEQEDEIIYRDPNKKMSFVNLKITGTPENYKISMGKNKGN